MNNQEFNEVFKLLLAAYPNTKDKESVATIYFLTIANELTKKEFAEAVVKIFNEIAPKYTERNGGYTRIIKTAVRRGDSAELAIIELV